MAITIVCQPEAQKHPIQVSEVEHTVEASSVDAWDSFALLGVEGRWRPVDCLRTIYFSGTF